MDPGPHPRQSARRLLGRARALLDRIRNRIDRWLWRREPEAERLRQAVRTARTITFVCHGNIIRSAYAEGLLRARAAGRLDIEVRSAGVAAVSGRPADPRAVALALERGLDLGSHRATSLGSLEPGPGELVLVMEARHFRPVLRQGSPPGRDVFLLGSFAPHGDPEIRDPYGATDVEALVHAFDRIEAAIDALIRLLLERGAGDA